MLNQHQRDATNITHSAARSTKFMRISTNPCIKQDINTAQENELSSPSTVPPFYNPFSETTQMSQCQKKIFFWTFMVQGRITEAHHQPPGRAPLLHLSVTHLQQSTSPIFTPDALPATTLTLSWLGTDTKYAGLHTQCHGFPVVRSELK